MTLGPRFVGSWQVSGTSGAVVAVDVLRAFTTAAYAFGAGASRILLVDSVADALALRARHRGAIVIGEDRGRRPDGFDLPNSPVEISGADVRSRTLILRTSAGTRGVVAARRATRLWCAGLVCASATARAVAASGLGEPTYLITGRFADQPDRPGHDDLATAELIERARLGLELDEARTARAVADSDEAALTLALGHGHVHPKDIEYAVQVDRFDFAMEVHRAGGLLELRRTDATG